MRDNVLTEYNYLDSQIIGKFLNFTNLSGKCCKTVNEILKNLFKKWKMSQNLSPI